MTTYVEIAVNIKKVSGEFHYHLPPELEGKVLPGHLVVVPFGKQRVQGPGEYLHVGARSGSGREDRAALYGMG